MEKKAFIKVETFDGGVHIQNGGTNYLSNAIDDVTFN